MGSHFSLSQWQELELQALIFRYMLVGASVPPELLQPIKKSLLHSSPYFLHHPFQHYHPTARKFHTTSAILNLYTFFHFTYFKTKQNKTCLMTCDIIEYPVKTLFYAQVFIF